MKKKITILQAIKVKMPKSPDREYILENVKKAKKRAGISKIRRKNRSLTTKIMSVEP